VLSDDVFYSYAIHIGNQPYYYGFGSSDYGDGRGRIEEHEVKLRMVKNGGLSRHKIYAQLLAISDQAHSPITFVKHYEGDSEIKALESESQLVTAHKEHYGTPLLNRKVAGKVVSEDTSLNVLNAVIPVEGYALWKHKWKLRLHEKKLRRLRLFRLADIFAEKYRTLKVVDTEVVNATIAVQRATRLALRKGYADIADRLDMSRTAEIYIKEHRDNVTLALEAIRMRELLACTYTTELERRSYLARLHYHERRQIEQGNFVFANQIAARLRVVRKGCLVLGIRCLKSNAEVIEALQSPALACLSYAELAVRFGKTPANMVRLVRLSGIQKVNAKSHAKEMAKQAFVSDPLTAVNWAAAGVTHNLCRMTAYRYAKEADLIANRKSKTSGLPKTVGVLAHPIQQAKVSGSASSPPEIPTAICHQRLIRNRTRDEDIARLTPVIGDLSKIIASQFELSVEDYADCHRKFIRRYEWLGTPGSSIKWCFVARYKNEIGGVVLLSEPYHPSVDTALIARGACAGWTPKNLGSRLVMYACRWMSSNTHKCQFIAYADKEAGEIGQIYQACNFRFLGWKTAEYGVTKEGRRVSFQTLKRTSRMTPWLAKQGISLPPSCFTEKGFLRWKAIPVPIKCQMRSYIAQEKAKLSKVVLLRGKYLLLLGSTPTKTRKLNAEFNGPQFDYPKRSQLQLLPTGKAKSRTAPRAQACP
jgi:hypothetical protein